MSEKNGNQCVAGPGGKPYPNIQNRYLKMKQIYIFLTSVGLKDTATLALEGHSSANFMLKILSVNPLYISKKHPVAIKRQRYRK